MLLVGATFAAFFAAQRIKGEPAVAQVVSLARVFSPNGDGRKEVNRFEVELRERSEIRVDVVDSAGNAVRRLADGATVGPRRPLRLEWDGRTDDGERVRDGRYRVRVTLRREGRSVIVPRTTLVDTRAPRPRVKAIEPGPHRRAGGGAGADRGRLGLAPAEEARARLAHRRRRAARRRRARTGRGLAHAGVGRARRRRARAARGLHDRGDRPRPRGQPRYRPARGPAAAPAARPPRADDPRDRGRGAAAAGHVGPEAARQRRRARAAVPLAAAPRRHAPSRWRTAARARASRSS